MEGNMIYDDFVERVRSESDIVAAISDYVALKKKGNRYWGCCPFHSEKTPSFSVLPEKGFFYCFGCHAGGNVFKFISMIENLSYFDAIKFQANKLNIPLPQREKTEQELIRERELVKLYRVHEMARDFFHACLTKTKYGIQAKTYFLQRGINEKIIEDFKLGFAPQSWSKLSEAFQKRGISDELLIESGLAAERSSGGVYDRFRNRVIIPICDERSRVVGFGGRVLDDSQPKYLNSSETLIFNKRRLLFALDQAAKSIKESGFVIVVEGYMDAITAHNSGIKNVVASLGTAFTLEQCKKILRYAPEIRFAYDSDSAGQNATIRALSIIRGSGANVRVISIPDGKDPDEYIRKHGPTEFRKLIKDALPLVEYQMKRAFSEFDYSTLEGKVAVVEKLTPILAEMNNAVELNAYITRISQVIGVDEGAIRSEIHKSSGLARTQMVKPLNSSMRTIAKKVDNAVIQAGRHVINTVWMDPSILPYLDAQLMVNEFQTDMHREIIQFLSDSYKNKKTINDLTASSHLSEKANAELSHCLLDELESEDRLQLLDDCIKTIHLAHLRKLYEEHRLKADELERMGDEGFVQELAESQRIKNEIDKI